MIVCGNSFRALGILAFLVPNRVLPPIDADPRSTNLQFFTEHSAQDSRDTALPVRSASVTYSESNRRTGTQT